jgi:SnoaL-like polyketide cyclase
MVDRPQEDQGGRDALRGAPESAGSVHERLLGAVGVPRAIRRFSLRPCGGRARRARDEVREFASRFREAFPDLVFGAAADLIAEGDYVVGQWNGGGTNTGPAFDDLPMAFGSRSSPLWEGDAAFRFDDGLRSVDISPLL